MNNPDHTWNQHRLAAEKAVGQGRLDMAETELLIALRLAEDFEKNDKRYAFTLEKLAECYFKMGNLTKANLYCEQVLGVYTDLFGEKHMDVACIAGNLAMICHALKNYRKAEKYYLSALAVKNEALGYDHPEVTKLRSNYADLLKITNRDKEADDLKTGASVVTSQDWKKSTGSFPARKPNKNGDKFHDKEEAKPAGQKESVPVNAGVAEKSEENKLAEEPAKTPEPPAPPAPKVDPTRTQDNMRPPVVEARQQEPPRQRSGAPLGGIDAPRASATQERLPAAQTKAQKGITSESQIPNELPPVVRSQLPPPRSEPETPPAKESTPQKASKLPIAPGRITSQNLPAQPPSETLTTGTGARGGSPASKTQDKLPASGGALPSPPSSAHAESPTSELELPKMVPPGSAGKAKLSKEEASTRWNQLKTEAEQLLNGGNLKDCEAKWHDALEIAGLFGSSDPKLSYTLESLANIKFLLQNYRVAENYYLRAYEIKLKVLGQNHIAIAGSANNLARLYYQMCEYRQAEKFSKMCIQVYENLIGSDNPNVATSLHNLATLYHVQRKYKEAEPAYKRSLEIKKKILGPDHPETVKLLKSYADLLRSTNRAAEADELSSAAIGLISGTWKTFDIKDSATLASTEDRCDICAAKLDGASKCPSCGFEVSLGVI